MSSPLVTLNTWVDARTPPDTDRVVLVDYQGFSAVGWYRVSDSGGEWFAEDQDQVGWPILVKATRWCDLPVPPAPDGLTIDDLRYLLGVLDSLTVQPYDRMEAVARVRALLPKEDS